MKICEVYKSIQGEGPAMGDLMTFVRTSGCNLRCDGCDTSHEDGMNASISDIVEICERMKNIQYYDQVLITGGEPFIQPEIPDLIRALSDADFIVDVETNGTLSIPEDLIHCTRYIVVSPKKGYPISRSILDKISRYVYWKFVVGPRPWMWTISQINEFIDRHEIEPDMVYLMPYDDNQNSSEVWEYCLRYGYNYSDRLQYRHNQSGPNGEDDRS